MAKGGKASKKGGATGKPTTERPIAENRKARHRFEVLESLECGIALVGSEVKSLRDGKISLEEAYGRVREGEFWLVGAIFPNTRRRHCGTTSPSEPASCSSIVGNYGSSPARLTKKDSRSCR